MSDIISQDILFIPEVAGLDARFSILRIPPELDVPLTPRVRRIIDSRPFRRLSKITQLGFVRLVYPGATHTRFEHSLGVYRLALLILKRLAYDSRFTSLISPYQAELLILSALLHDIGHFPFCHLFEDLKTTKTFTHEKLAEAYINGELADIIRKDWHIDPQHVCDVILKRIPKQILEEPEEVYAQRKKSFHLLSSILSGPIDVDKMDYLMRDSHGAGVPYGKNYDIERLVGSICLNERGDGIAITSKGKTATELMVFARYIMFSEVYWHHTARSATVMFQRCLYNIGSQVGFLNLAETMLECPEEQIYNMLSQLSENCSQLLRENRGSINLLSRLFGYKRKLFKRLREFTAMEEPFLYEQIAGKTSEFVKTLSDNLASRLGLEKDEILIDSPPVDKEVEFKIDVYFPQENKYRPLSEVSPVIQALAKEQFDKFVKKVRIFVAPERIDELRERELSFDELLQKTLDVVSVSKNH